MRRLVMLVFILQFAAAAVAQVVAIDSFNNLIRKAKSDTARINLENKKNIIISRMNVDSGIVNSKRIIAQAKAIGYADGEASAMVRLATNYCIKGDFSLAKENLSAALEKFRSIGDSVGICDTWSGYGMMYGMQSKYDSSITVLEKAIAIAERNHLTENLPVYYGNIAIGHQMQSDFRNALYYQQKSLDLAKQTNDRSDMAYTSLNMGLTYSNMDDSVRAKRFLLDALQLAKAEKLINVELYAYSNLADLFNNSSNKKKAYDYAINAARLGAQMGDQGIQAASLSKAAGMLADMDRPGEALRLARQATIIADSSGQNFNRYQAYAALGAIIKRNGNCKEALIAFEKSIAMLSNTDIYNDAVSKTFSLMSDCYEQTGNYPKALSFFKTAAEISDSVSSLQNIRKATELTMNYEFDKKQEAQRIAQKNKDIITRSRQNLLITGLVLTLLLAFFAYRAYRIKQKSNDKLEYQKAEIQSALLKLERTQAQLVQAEKMASLGSLTAGIAHEIQNPLNFVNNFAEVSRELLDEMKSALGQGDIEEAKEIAEDVIQNLAKINHHGKKADDIVKSMLEHSHTNAGQKELTDINALSEKYINLAYHGINLKYPAFKAEVKTEFDHSLDKVDIVPQDIGRVILNLLTNAFYSVHQKNKLDGVTDLDWKPSVTLKTCRQTSPETGAEEISILITDNGTGVPKNVKDKIFQPFFTTKPTGQGTGLGLSLSYDVIKAHGGEMSCESIEGEYATFIINLPISTI